MDITLLFELLLIGYVFYTLGFKKESLQISGHLLIPGMLLAAAASFSMVYFPTTGYGLDKYIKLILISIGTCMFLAQFLIKDRKSVEKFFLFVLFLSAVIGLYALFTGTRESFASDYIFVGKISGIALIISTFYFRGKYRGAGRIFFLILCPLIAYVMLYSGARGPVIALVSAGLLGIILSLARDFTVQRLVKAICIILVISVSFFTLLQFNLLPGIFMERMSLLIPSTSTSEHDASYNERVRHIELSLDMASQHPLTGVGIGNYIRYLSMAVREYPHNIFLEIGSELGLPVLFMFCLFLFVGYAKIFSLFFKRQPKDEGYGSFLITIFVLFTYLLICAQFSGDINDNKDLWFVLGLVYSTEALISNKKEDGNGENMHS